MNSKQVTHTQAIEVDLAQGPLLNVTVNDLSTTLQVNFATGGGVLTLKKPGQHAEDTEDI